jgi:acetolactate synthase-1/2/3 large subunit
MNNADLIVAIVGGGITRGFGSERQRAAVDGRHGGRVDFVLTAHEGSAGFAADVTAMTGAPGFCIATLGPGDQPDRGRPVRS